MNKDVKAIQAKRGSTKKVRVSKPTLAKPDKDGNFHLTLKSGEDRVFNPNDEETLMKIVVLYENLSGENSEKFKKQLEDMLNAETDDAIATSSIRFIYEYSRMLGEEIDKCVGEGTCIAEFGTHTPSITYVKDFLIKLNPIYSAIIEVKGKEWSSIFTIDERDNM